MNDKLFEQMMSAVDDDLLEEAQLPMNKQRTTKSKRAWAILAAGAAACIALVAATTLHTPKAPPSGDVQVINPLKTVSVSEVEALGYSIPLPADAQEASYFLIDTGKEQAVPMAEVRFGRNGGSYTFRAQKAAASEDISGLYVNWNQHYTLSADTLNVTVSEAEDLTACVSWYEAASGIQWCLSGDRGATDLLTTASDILNTLGYNLDVSPNSAQETQYRTFDLDGLSVGETTFVLDAITYTYRVAATLVIEENFADISGINTAFTQETTGEVGWCSARLSYDPDASGKIVWFDPAPGLLYSLHMSSGASEEALINMAETLYSPAQDNAG